MGTMTAQQRLLSDAPAVDFGCAPGDPVRRVFEHWLCMLQRNPRRCKLGPSRRAAISTMLTVYEGDVEVLELAIEGMAADPLDDCPPRMRDAMRELEWLLGKECRVERWAERGEALRVQFEQEAECQARRVIEAASAPANPGVDAQTAQAERLASMRALADWARRHREGSN